MPFYLDSAISCGNCTAWWIRAKLEKPGPWLSDSNFYGVRSLFSDPDAVIFMHSAAPIINLIRGKMHGLGKCCYDCMGLSKVRTVQIAKTANGKAYEKSAKQLWNRVTTSERRVSLSS